MYTTYNSTKKGIGLLLLLAVFSFPLTFISCSDDDNEFSGDPFFMIEENPTGISTGVNGESKSYIVRSNRPWQIVPQGEADWVKTFPIEIGRAHV